MVSHWNAIRQLAVHGLTSGDRDSAYEAVSAGVDMQMAGDAYTGHLEGLVAEGRIGVGLIDEAVVNILRTKFRLGLFDRPYVDPGRMPTIGEDEKMRIAKTAALLRLLAMRRS